MGFYDIITVEIKNGEITSVVWDAKDAAGRRKTRLSMDGIYRMSQTGAAWHEQAQALGAYVVEHQSAAGLSKEENAADAVSGVTIHILPFLHGLEECLNQAVK